MKIGVLKEIKDNEKRVAITPNVVSKIKKLGYDVLVENNLGSESNFYDDQYIDNGAEVATKDEVYKCDLLLKINKPSQEEVSQLSDSQTLVSFFSPALNSDLLELCKKDKIKILSMDSVPRISRAQKMDALSSMANVAGSRAVIEAAHCFGRFFGGQITAAGKINPAKILIIGAGVAGLSAIGTASSLGAIVRAFDTRPEVKEQVESMDADFLMLDFEEEGSGSGGYAKVMSEEFIKAEMALFAEQAEEVDIIITTALIPGKPAPELITEDMVKSMREGSVIVDLAAAMGGNCKLSEPDKVVVKHGVSIIGYTDLPSRLPTQSSQLYATNLRHLLNDMTPEKDGVIQIDFEDEAIRGATVTKDGEITFPPPAPKLSAAPVKKDEPKEDIKTISAEEEKGSSWLSYVLGGVAFLGLGLVAPASFVAHFTVFVLACFVGYMVIWNVSPALHTPLMSVTNAISSIIIIGALLQISAPDPWVMGLSGLAVLITSINIFGGFAVTQRMLDMFKK